MFSKIISDLSCDESTYNNAKIIYDLALKSSGYKSEIKFNRQPSTRGNSNRKFIWFKVGLSPSKKKSYFASLKAL